MQIIADIVVIVLKVVFWFEKCLCFVKPNEINI